MQGNFEKQVQDKLDGLKLPPSPPVWGNIEDAIKQKRRRRMPLLWWLFGLLLAGGGFIYFSGKNFNSSFEKEKITSTKEPVKGTKHNDSSGRETNISVLEENTTAKNLENEKKSATTIKSFESNDEASKQKASQKSRRKKLPAKTSAEIYQADNAQIDPEIIKEKPVTDLLSDTTSANSVVQHLAKKEKKVESNDSSTQLLQKRPEKKSSKNSKWQLGFTAEMGLAGIIKGQNSNGFTTAGLPGIQYAPGTRRGFHYSFGIRLGKDIDERLALSTGVRYSDFNTLINAGNKVNGDTVLSSIRVNGFYPTTASANHNNHYRFIIVPFELDYRLLKKRALLLHAGVSVNQLVGRDALQFDKASGLYYENKDGLSGTQVFSTLGLSYPLFSINKTQFCLGPKVQYGLTKIQKSGNNDRLFSLGFSLSAISKKNK